VLEAKPVIVFVASNTCFRSKPKIEFAAILTAGTKDTLSSAMVAVTAAVVELAITILVTTAVLPEGVVYSVDDVVAAAVRARTFETTAISYCILS